MDSDSSNAQQPKESQWCLVGNIVQERRCGEGGKEVRQGTKHFAGGTKVYCLSAQWDGYEKIKMIGRHRGSKQFITLITNAEWVTNWRAQVVYNPEVLRRIKMATKAPWGSREEVEKYVSMLVECEARRNANTGGSKKQEKAICRYCNAVLPSHLAQQCLACGWDWHNPDTPVKRGKPNWNRWGIDEKLMYHVVLCQRADGYRYYEFKTIDEIDTNLEIVRMTDPMSGAEVLAWLKSGRKEHLKLTTGEQFLLDAHDIWLTYSEAIRKRDRSVKWWQGDQSFWVNGIPPLFPPA